MKKTSQTHTFETHGVWKNAGANLDNINWTKGAAAAAAHGARETLRVVRVMGRPCGNNIYTSHCKLRGGLRRLLIGTLEKYLGRRSPSRIAGGA